MVIMTEKNMKRITLNVDANLHKKIKLIADAKDVSINELLVEIIEKEVDETDIVELIKSI